MSVDKIGHPETAQYPVICSVFFSHIDNNTHGYVCISGGTNYYCMHIALIIDSYNFRRTLGHHNRNRSD